MIGLALSKYSVKPSGSFKHHSFITFFCAGVASPFLITASADASARSSSNFFTFSTNVLYSSDCLSFSSTSLFSVCIVVSTF